MADPTQERESGFFVDYHNVRVGAAAVRDIDGLRPEDAGRWQSWSSNDRIASLQKAENRLASLQHRPAERVFGESMNDDYGYYEPSGAKRGIYVNTRNLDDRAESLNTIVHEGRHAYQYHAIRNPGAHPEKPELSGQCDPPRWQANTADYKTVGKHGSHAYMTQPLEHDAGNFGFAVTKGVYPDYTPRPNRIDQYNARNAEDKYGHLKLSPESQKFDRRQALQDRIREGARESRGMKARESR